MKLAVEMKKAEDTIVPEKKAAEQNDGEIRGKRSGKGKGSSAMTLGRQEQTIFDAQPSYGAAPANERLLS